MIVCASNQQQVSVTARDEQSVSLWVVRVMGFVEPTTITRSGRRLLQSEAQTGRSHVRGRQVSCQVFCNASRRAGQAGKKDILGVPEELNHMQTLIQWCVQRNLRVGEEQSAATVSTNDEHQLPSIRDYSTGCIVPPVQTGIETQYTVRETPSMTVIIGRL